MFEGFKRIKNLKKLAIEDVYSILADYQKEMGTMQFDSIHDNKVIIVKFKGKYDIKIKAFEEEVIIERVLEDGEEKDEEPTKETGKKIELAQVDRMIDQIYDLLNDYMDDEFIKETITTSKKELRMKLKEQNSFLGIGRAILGDEYEITDENNRCLYLAEDNRFNKTYSIKNMQNHMEVASINYSKSKINKFTIIEKPFQITEIQKDSSTEKLRFIPAGTGQKLKITGDYTDNHFIVELDEIVIGAIDSLDPKTRKIYRIEVNNLKKENLLIAITLMIDSFAKKEISNIENI